jgi:hypothetical protein
MFLVIVGVSWSPLFSQPQVDSSKLTVVMCNDSPASSRTLQFAESTASEILRSGGVQVAWSNITGEAVPEPASVCDEEPEANEFRVRILSHQPKSELIKTVFGRAVFPNTAILYYELVDRLAKVDNADFERPIVLGTLIAHEIGHLLLGPGRHSSTGIMRAQWDGQQIQKALKGRLSFSRTESAQIQAQAKQRLRVEAKTLMADGNCCSGKAVEGTVP